MNQYRGSLIGNSVLVVGFVILQYIIAFVLAKAGRRRSSSSSSLFESSLADVHAPGLSAVLIMTFSVPTAMSIGVVGSILANENFTASVSIYLELAVGIFFYLALPLFGFFSLARKLINDKKQKLIKMAELEKPEHKPNASLLKNLLSILQYGFDYLLEPSKNWKETTFVKRYCDVMDCCAVPVFVVFDYLVAVVIGLVSGLSILATSKSQCLTFAIIILVFCLLHTLSILFLKPMTARFDSWFGMIASFFSLASAVFGLLEILGVGVQIEEALMYVATICMLGSAVAFLGSAAPVFKSLKKLLKARRVAASSSSSRSKKAEKEKTQSKKNKKDNNKRTMMNLEELNNDDDENPLAEELVPVVRTEKDEEIKNKNRSNNNKPSARANNNNNNNNDDSDMELLSPVGNDKEENTAKKLIKKKKKKNVNKRNNTFNDI